MGRRESRFRTTLRDSLSWESQQISNVQMIAIGSLQELDLRQHVFYEQCSSRAPQPTSRSYSREQRRCGASTRVCKEEVACRSGAWLTSFTVNVVRLTVVPTFAAGIVARRNGLFGVSLSPMDSHRVSARTRLLFAGVGHYSVSFENPLLRSSRNFRK